MTSLHRIHFWVGISGLVVFILTGQYMYHVHHHLEGMPDGPRMIFRSGHIYFLMASILNLFVGINPGEYREKRKRIIQSIISFLILASPLLILAGFFTEPHMQALARPWSQAGAFALFGAALLGIYLGLSRER